LTDEGAERRKQGHYGLKTTNPCQILKVGLRNAEIWRGVEVVNNKTWRYGSMPLFDNGLNLGWTGMSNNGTWT
jgi:hypothetical protein